MPRLLDAEELTRQLADLPGVDKDVAGALTLAVKAPSFADAVRLITFVAADAEAMDHHPDVDLRWRTVTFVLSTHSEGGITQLDIELAHQILAAAREVGAEFLPVPERVEIALDCASADAVRPFWAAALGYVERRTLSGAVELQDPAGRGPALWFQHMDPPRAERSRFHLDVYVPDAATARERVDAALAAGGTLLTDEHAPGFWVLADSEGNEVCICTREGED